MQSDKLILSLLEQTTQITDQVRKLKTFELNSLTWRPNEGAWNILECIEHLNLYGNYYLPVIAHQIEKSGADSDPEFRSGWLGNYFANTMLPKEPLNKMKTFKSKNPINAKLDLTVLDTFINQQKELSELLKESKRKSLNKIRIPISISPFIKLKLGDTFRFYINHVIRHLNQIDRIKEKMGKAQNHIPG